MSAFYSVAYPDRVELITDGAVYTDDGTLVEVRRKVWASSSLPLAVTGRGSSRLVEGLAAAINVMAECGSVDGTLGEVAGMLEKYRDRDCEPFEIVLAAVSETNGPGIYHFSNVDAYGLFAAWQLHGPYPEFGGGPSLTDANREMLAAEFGGDGTLTRAAVPLFEAMRRRTAPKPTSPHLPEIYGIGGHVDFTTVSAAGCTIERLCEWPDPVGEKIDPFRLSAAAA